MILPGLWADDEQLRSNSTWTVSRITGQLSRKAFISNHPYPADAFQHTYRCVWDVGDGEQREVDWRVVNCWDFRLFKS
jgi:hypothetical protein